MIQYLFWFDIVHMKLVKWVHWKEAWHKDALLSVCRHWRALNSNNSLPGVQLDSLDSWTPCIATDILVRTTLFGITALWSLCGVHWSFQPVIFNIYAPTKPSPSIWDDHLGTDRLSVQQPVFIANSLSLGSQLLLQKPLYSCVYV